MKHMNLVIIEGLLTEEPDLKPKRGDRPAFAHFNIISRGREGVEAEFTIHSHGRLAEVSAQLLKKGSRVLISGSIIAGGRIEAREIKFLPGSQK